MTEIQKENEELQDTSKRALKEVKKYLGQAGKDKLLFGCVTCCGCVCMLILCVLLILPLLKPVTCLAITLAVDIGFWNSTPTYLTWLCGLYEKKTPEPVVDDTTTSIIHSLLF